MCEFVVIIWQDLSAWLSVKLHHDFNLKIYINCLDLKNATEYFRLLTDYFNMRVLLTYARLLTKNLKMNSILQKVFILSLRTCLNSAQHDAIFQHT